MLRTTLHDVEVDASDLVQYLDRIVLEDGSWRVLDRLPRYIQDRFDPVRRDAKLELRDDLPAKCPTSARHLVYPQFAARSAPDPMPSTLDSPQATAITTDAKEWLAEAA
ncbi:hypothetical protein ORV05_13710 [Amycolatopsis cynarae]|uniref:Uncharacterized protein n=2 Tax=Amycolatopsis cynarae TaxID=2995223 RepID=A0ABY7BA11_9PSEU|nr:hypothetical protein ORV05_13710 [Amycolatopsis sp. HUAS 11-8]